MLVLAAGNFECMPNVVGFAVIVTPNSEMCNDNAAVSVLVPHFRQ